MKQTTSEKMVIEILDMLKEMKRKYSNKKVYLRTEYGKLDVESEDFHDFIVAECLSKYGFVVKDSTIKQVKAGILSERLTNKVKNAKYRINKQNDTIYYDLSNVNDAYVKITSDGWSIESEPISLFKESDAQCSQVTPLRGSNLDIARKYFNIIDDNQWLLFKTYMVYNFFPFVEHPILNIMGEKGSAKSTMLRLIKTIVDPSHYPLTTLSKNLDDLEVILGSSYFIAFDNLSSLTKDQRNTFCIVVTGGSSGRRAKYTDRSMTYIDFEAIVAVNGIQQVAHADDYVERSLFIKVERVQNMNRIPKERLNKDFNDDLPYILGAIFDIISKALSIKPSIELDGYHRMAEFTEYGSAIAEAITEGGKDLFLKALDENELINELSFNKNINVLHALHNYAYAVDGWSGTIDELTNNLNELYANDENVQTFFNNTLGKVIKDELFIKLCNVQGFQIEHYRDNKNRSCVKVTKLTYDNLG